MKIVGKRLDDTLSEHSFSHAHETGDVSTLNIVDGAIRLFTVFNAHVIDVVHDFVQFSVNFGSCPVDVTCVLADFETGGSNTTSVDSLTRTERNASFLESFDSARLATHVGNFSNIFHAVSEKFLSVSFIHFVLESARTSDVTFHAPSLLTSREFSSCGEFVSHILNFVAVGSTHIKHIVNHFRSDSVSDFANAIRTGDSHNLSAEFNSLDSSTPSYVTEAGESNSLTFHGVVLLFYHAFNIVNCAETGSFRTDEGTTPAVRFTCERARAVLAGQFLVSTVEVADFTTANANVASRAVLVRTDVAPQFIHVSLAETHDFSIALSCGIEIGTTLATAERKVGQTVFENLFET